MNYSVLWKNVLGDVFSVNCGVRQGGVLSPILFSIYVDDLVDLLRQRLRIWHKSGIKQKD